MCVLPEKRDLKPAKGSLKLPSTKGSVNSRKYPTRPLESFTKEHFRQATAPPWGVRGWAFGSLEVDPLQGQVWHAQTFFPESIKWLPVDGGT